MPIRVALAKQPTYAPHSLKETVSRLFTAIDFAPPTGARVLVKPNLVAATKGPLGCSEPAVMRAVCELMLDAGARPTVGDSPAFGSAMSVAAKVGITEALQGLDVPIINLGRPARLTLSFGQRIGISQDALDADLVLNVPRLKAHIQMRITASVKNLFGCVCGMRKALAHSRWGEQHNRFEAMILDVAAALPPVVTLLDGVTAMHITGPTGGEPFALGMLGAAKSPIALDTAAYGVLHLAPTDLALWREAQHRNLPGADPQDVAYPLEAPEAFDASGFVIPGTLKPVSFHPLRLARGAVKRAIERLK